MISSKYLHDDGEEDEVFTDEWARSGDITVPELCQLEKEFLNAIVSLHSVLRQNCFGLVSEKFVD